MKITAVLPAYNAARTLAQTVADIPADIVDEIILVDDASHDGTAALARRLGLVVVEHPRNRGYGGNQKTCYATALAHGADIVVMVHPDHQYDPHYVRQLVRPLQEGSADAAFGSRLLMRGGALAGGMPEWKYVGNRLLTNAANLILGQRLSEYHSGFRAYTRRVLERLPLEQNSDDFVFDTEIIVQLVQHQFRIAEIAIPTRYFKDASSINFSRSVRYGLDILGTLAAYRLSRLGWRSDARFPALATPAELPEQ